jgi:large subunit ribosomal protein L15
MQLHQIQPKHKSQEKHRVGRGGKKGTYSGRGIKGQKARAGARFKPIIRELIKRYPKLRGYRHDSASPQFQIVSLGAIDKVYSENEVVRPESLLAKRLVRQQKEAKPKVKILGGGILTKALEFQGCAVSKNAKARIEKAGGSVTP